MRVKMQRGFCMAMILVAALLLPMIGPGKGAYSEGLQLERVWASIGNSEVRLMVKPENGTIQERTEIGAVAQAHAVSEVNGIEPQSQIDDKGDLTSIISNLDDPALKFWLTGTTHYRIDPAYSPVIIFENTLGGEGIEVKPGTRTRQAYLIKDGRAERLERALETRFYRAEHFTERFPTDFDYLGFCDYRETVMTLVPNPFLLEEELPQADSAAPEAPSREEAIYANHRTDSDLKAINRTVAAERASLADDTATKEGTRRLNVHVRAVG